MKYKLVLLFVLFNCTHGFLKASPIHHVEGPLLWDLYNLLEIREKNDYYSLREDIIQKAESYVLLEPLYVTQKTHAHLVKDNHYYYSIGIYWWPDESDRTKPYVWRDGLVNPEYKEYDYYRLMELVERTKTLSVAYFLTGEQKFYNCLVEQINTWFINPDTYMYPNFDYGQVVPGHNNGEGRPQGISEARFLIPVFESLLLTNFVTPIDNKIISQVKEWSYNLALWMTSSMFGRKERLANNNHAFIYDALLAYLAVFSEHEELADWVLTSFGGQLKSQINKYGQFQGELSRTQAYSYSIVCLTEIINVCMIEERVNNYLFEDNKDIILSTIQYLTQFIGHKELFPYQQLYDWKYYEQELIFQINRVKRLKNGEIVTGVLDNYVLTKCYKELMLQ